jgi:DNA polymerase-3 subunit beta
MNITFNTKELINKIKNIAPTAEAKQTLAILGNMKIDVKDNNAVFTASDLEIEVSTSVRCNSDDDGSITIPAKKMLEICNALSAHDEVKLSVSDTKADLTAGNSKVSLQIIPAADYPKMESTTTGKPMSIPIDELYNIINKTSFAMAYQDARHFLNGLHVCSHEGNLISVCTDGHRLAKYTSSISCDDDISIIIPRKCILEINRILGAYNDNKDIIAELYVNNNSLVIKIDDYILVSKLIEGNYPNFNKVIPETTKSKITIERTILKNSLNIISKVVNQQYKGVKLTPSKESLHLISSNTESEVGEDQIDAKYDGDELSIGFNISYIQDVIDILSSEKINICINDQNSGCVLLGDSEPTSVFVIMPMRV